MFGDLLFTVGMIVLAMFVLARPLRALAARQSRWALLREKTTAIAALEGIKTTSIATLQPDERAKVAGVVAARDYLLKSPISGDAWIGFRVIVETNLGILAKREACGAFTLTDGTGTAGIDGPFQIALDPDDAAWANLPPAVFALLQEEMGRDAWAVISSEREVRFQEALLKPGDRIAVLGRATMEIDPAGHGSYREAPMLIHFRGTDDQPVVIVDVEDTA